jgi:hypothetical protein
MTGPMFGSIVNTWAILLEFYGMDQSRNGKTFFYQNSAKNRECKGRRHMALGTQKVREGTGYVSSVSLSLGV